MKKTLAAGEQTLLFLNRRGYAPITLCRSCGKGIECPQCSAWLVEHRFRRMLVCHHCGYSEPPAATCKSCGAVDHFVACGPGVERLAEEAHAAFPEARVELFTSDSLMNREEATAAIERMIGGEIDILIGTQMAAKGHHFPNLTLVAVIDADLGLNGGDLRAAERTFQLLYQVAGRAGRHERPGRALIQTHAPEHPVMQALVANDRDRFVAAELAGRAGAGMPPYGRLASLIVSGSRSCCRGQCLRRHRPPRPAEGGRHRARPLGGADGLAARPAPAAVSSQDRPRYRSATFAACMARANWPARLQCACKSTSIPIHSCDRTRGKGR